MSAETGIKTESGIVLVTGSNGTIVDAVMRRFAGRFEDVVGFDRKAPDPPPRTKKRTVDAELEKLQLESFGYFLHETNGANGLVIDKTEADWPASTAATGLALASYPVAVERGFMPRAEAVDRTLTVNSTGSS